MQRKWITLAASMAGVAVLAVGLTYADEDSPLHKLMEKVQASNVAITKGTRNQTNFSKQQQKVVSSAKDLAKYAKESRPIDEPAKKQKQPHEKWTQICDDWAKAAETLADVAAKARINNKDEYPKDFAKVKAAFATVKKACADCHKDFRVEEDEKKF